MILGWLKLIFHSFGVIITGRILRLNEDHRIVTITGPDLRLMYIGCMCGKCFWEKKA